MSFAPTSSFTDGIAEFGALVVRRTVGILTFLVHGTPSSRPAGLGLLVLRILVFGALAATHGYPTVAALVRGATEYPDPLGLGPVTTMVLMGASEFLAAALVVVGLGTRLACISLVVGFGVAFFVFHAADPFGQKELAYLYLSASVCILLTGPGRYSVDWVLIGSDRETTNGGSD